MKTQQILLTTSVLAIADLSRMRFVGFDGSVCAAGAKALGPCEATTSAGEQAPVNMTGALLVEAGGPITALDVADDLADGVLERRRRAEHEVLASSSRPRWNSSPAYSQPARSSS